MLTARALLRLTSAEFRNYPTNTGQMALGISFWGTQYCFAEKLFQKLYQPNREIGIGRYKGSPRFYSAETH